MKQHKDAEARETLEEGLRVHPESAHLRAVLAALTFDIGDRRRAQTLLEEAERINPDLEAVKVVRRIISEQQQIINKHKKR